MEKTAHRLVNLAAKLAEHTPRPLGSLRSQRSEGARKTISGVFLAVLQGFPEQGRDSGSTGCLESVDSIRETDSRERERQLPVSCPQDRLIFRSRNPTRKYHMSESKPPLFLRLWNRSPGTVAHRLGLMCSVVTPVRSQPCIPQPLRACSLPAAMRQPAHPTTPVPRPPGSWR